MSPGPERWGSSWCNKVGLLGYSVEEESVDNVSSLKTLHKKDRQPAVVSDGTQRKVEVNMLRIVEKYPHIFQGIGKVQLKLIHIHLRENNRKLVAQKPHTVALHLKESLRQHLKEFR